MFRLRLAAWLAAGLSLLPACAGAAPVAIVAAENFYGDLAQQIGGRDVTVTSILQSPDQDPHLFEASPSTARSIATAQIVVQSGIGYDDWMAKLAQASRAGAPKLLVVAPLAARRDGDNPHIWYDPQTMLTYAAVLTERLAAADPAHAADFRKRLAGFQASMHPVLEKIAALRTQYSGTPVTATEPVFGYLMDAVGLRNRNAAFQVAVMNDTEPSASDLAAFEQSLQTRAVKLLVYNSQATDPLADRMKTVAQHSGVSVLAVTETEPQGMTYQSWMLDVLNKLQQALAK
ncbi:metal ABC transporter solute-binding protein, Zn/Mn family [Bordetella sp. FB-8]|uniref:metal ABC transporter solute-binding protein, Zn/Mn family n=1 Tax=Bordetella sp. FB-8 TaxID=1159870 RepID=UPI00036CCFF5|nr:zinc ABC transporter substrate-binding protein [Bordetella sp. FB-8]